MLVTSMRKHQCSGRDPSEFSKPISMQSDWWKEREGNQGGVGRGDGRIAPKHLKYACNDPAVHEGIIQLKYEKANFRFLHCLTLHIEKIKIPFMISWRRCSFEIPLAVEQRSILFLWLCKPACICPLETHQQTWVSTPLQVHFQRQTWKTRCAFHTVPP